jgi:large subunit ribosomal protein L3
MEYIIEKIGMSRTITVPAIPVTLLKVKEAKVCEVNENSALIAYNGGKKINKAIEGQQKNIVFQKSLINLQQLQLKMLKLVIKIHQF